MARVEAATCESTFVTAEFQDVAPATKFICDSIGLSIGRPTRASGRRVKLKDRGRIKAELTFVSVGG